MRVAARLCSGGEETPQVVMSMTVKEELSRVAVGDRCCRRAELVTALRFSGGLHPVAGRVVMEAVLDTASAAHRLGRMRCAGAVSSTKPLPRRVVS